MDGVRWLSATGLERGRVVTSEFVNGWCPLGLLTFVRILASTLREVGFPACKESSGKESACQCQRCERCGFHLWVEKIPGAGNGNPLQYSCLGNSVGRGARRATVRGAAESQTRLSTAQLREASSYQTAVSRDVRWSDQSFTKITLGSSVKIVSGRQTWK